MVLLECNKISDDDMPKLQYNTSNCPDPSLLRNTIMTYLNWLTWMIKYIGNSYLDTFPNIITWIDIAYLLASGNQQNMLNFICTTHQTIKLTSLQWYANLLILEIYWSMLFWDRTECLFNNQDILPSRRTRRKKRLITVQSFPPKWMILAGWLMVFGWYTHPTIVLIHNTLAVIFLNQKPGNTYEWIGWRKSNYSG